MEEGAREGLRELARKGRGRGPLTSSIQKWTATRLSSATASPTRVQSCSPEGREDPYSRMLPGVERGEGDGREAVEKPAALTLEGMGSASCCERVVWSPRARDLDPKAHVSTGFPAVLAGQVSGGGAQVCEDTHLQEPRHFCRAQAGSSLGL